MTFAELPNHPLLLTMDIYIYIKFSSALQSPSEPRYPDAGQGDRRLWKEIDLRCFYHIKSQSTNQVISPGIC